MSIFRRFLKKKKRSDKYQSNSNSQDTIEKLSQKFTDDIRKQIKTISPECNIFSMQFLSDCVVLENISKIANIESRPNSYLLKDTTRKKNFLGTENNFDFGVTEKKQKTIWEREEYCLRYIIAEGKVNILIAKLAKFKEQQLEIRKNKINVVERIVSNPRLTVKPDFFLNRIDTFEKNLGTITLCLFTSIESVQTIEFKLLFDYIELILSYAVSSSYDINDEKLIIDLLMKQEYVALCVLNLILQRISSSSGFHDSDSSLSDKEKDFEMEEKIMGLLLPKRDMLKLLVGYYVKFYILFGQDEKTIIWHTISMIMESEEFMSYKSRYLDNDTKDILLSFYDETIKPLYKVSVRNRKLLKGLNDFCVKETISIDF